MRIIIVGCGRIGSGLAQVLSQAGHQITVVDLDSAAFKTLGPSFAGATVEGVGFDKDVLMKARIDVSDALAAVTSSDESNAVIARMAREVYRVPKVVARMYDRQKAEIFMRLGIETISSTKWGIKRAADILCYEPFHSVLSLGNGDVDVIEIIAPPMLVGQKVRDLMVPGEIQVMAITRGNKTYLPTMGMTFEKNDMLYITVAANSTGRMKRLLGME